MQGCVHVADGLRAQATARLPIPVGEEVPVEGVELVGGEALEWAGGEPGQDMELEVPPVGVPSRQLHPNQHRREPRVGDVLTEGDAGRLRVGSGVEVRNDLGSGSLSLLASVEAVVPLLAAPSVGLAASVDDDVSAGVLLALAVSGDVALHDSGCHGLGTALGDPEPAHQGWHGHQDPSAEASGWDFAPTAGFVCCRTAEAKEPGDFFDGEGHTPVERIGASRVLKFGACAMKRSGGLQTPAG